MKSNTKKPKVGDIVFVREGERIKNPSNANDLLLLNNRFISKDYDKIIMLNSSKAHPIHRGFVKLDSVNAPIDFYTTYLRIKEFKDNLCTLWVCSLLRIIRINSVLNK